MQIGCQAYAGTDSFAPGMIGFLDCQARTLGAQGYEALAAPGSIASVLLTGAITLLIAFIGYRMLLGHVPTIREGVLTFVRIGMVLVLATSWPAYQVIVYDVILRAPAELVASVGGPAGLPGSTGGLATRIDGADQAMKWLAIEGVGSRPLAEQDPSGRPSDAPAPFLGFDNFALGAARAAFLVSTLAAFAVARLVAGLLLALGPLFALFLLFDGTRGLFGSWLKALIGSALTALATAILIGVELSFLEPMLSSLIARRTGGLDIIGAPAQLLATSLIFALALIGVAVVVARVALGLRLPAWGGMDVAVAPMIRTGAGITDTGKTMMRAPLGTRSRATAIADAVAMTERRENNGMTMVTGGGSTPSPVGGRVVNQGVPSRYGAVSDRRRLVSRVSARSRVRDLRA